MESYLLDWANLLFRWAHVIVAIAWIGSSFYFVFLDSSLTPPEDDRLKAEGVTGEIWAVHGGGFYHPVKYAVSPPQLPGHLHWFFWESYSTWLTGFGLFTVSYLWRPDVFLVDPRVHAWAPWQAIALALGILVAFWLAYDAACRWLGKGPNGDRRVGIVVAMLVAGFAWLATEWFAARAAFLITGAMLATTMSANVLFWIIPGQRKVVAALRAGQPVDPIHGQRGKQRSVHNTYFTLPVLLAMLSNHYSFLYAHEHPAVVLVVMMAAGAAIRQFFVLRHGYKLGKHGHPWPWVAAGLGLLLVMVVWLKPSVPAEGAGNAAPTMLSDEQAVALVQQRCAMCHGEALASKGVRLDSLIELKKHAPLAYQQVAVLKLMPLNNATGLTDDERSQLGRWLQAQP